MVRQLAKHSGFKTRFTRIEALEIFCDIFHKDGDKTMLYKNWDDDVFVFGNTITIDRRGKNFKERFYKIHNICASHYLSILFPPGPIWPKLDIFLQTCVDEAGFNEKVLEKVLQRFTKVRNKVKPFLK